MTIEAFRADLIKKMGEKNFNKVRSVRVGIAGAGGLGSNCALNLVRVGFEKLTIADFDRVDASNLDRQFYFLDQVGKIKVEALKENLLRINPALELKIVNKKKIISPIVLISKLCDQNGDRVPNNDKSCHI